MEILIKNVSVEEINSALLRIKRQIKDDQAQLVTRVQEIIDNSKTTTITNENDYDDSSIKKDITNLYNTQTALSNQVEKDGQRITENTEAIQTLSNALSVISVFYDYDSNELVYVDRNGNVNNFELKDTSYTFDWTDGILTITDDISGEETEINFDNRYYNKSEIQSLILDLIPSTASSSNQLADKDFVNSSIETATATFRGTFTVLADLLATSGDKNDYAYLKTLDPTSGIYSFDKYTYGTNGWEYAYTINSSGFTAEQLAALNSGITSNLVSKITDVNNSTITVCQGTTCVGSFTLNQATDYTLNLQEGGGISGICRCCCTGNINLPLLASGGCSNLTIDTVFANPYVYYNPSTGSLYACTFRAGSTIYGPNYIELYSPSSTPYLDFHFCNYCGDYSQRLISRCGRLDIAVNNGYCNTASTQSATYCFNSNGYLCLPSVYACTRVCSPLLCSTNTICGAGYFRQICIFKPEVCTTSAGWCQCHFYAFADVTVLFDGSNHGGACYTAGFVGNIFEHRDNGGHAENITQAIARMGYSCAQRVLCYFPTMGQDWVEPRVLYKCDECKYYLGLWFKAQKSSHHAVLEGVFQVGSCVSITPKWICSCTPAGDIACSCWAVCGSKASLSLNINSATVGCTYGMTLNCNNQLYCSNNIFSDGSTIYSNAFNGLFNRCITDVTSQVCILGCNCDVVKCATFDKNFNMYHVFVCTKSNIAANNEFNNCIQFPGPIDKVYAKTQMLTCNSNTRGLAEVIWTGNGTSCQLCFSSKNVSGSTLSTGCFCLRIDVPACATSPLLPHSPSYPEAVLSDWEYKDTKCINMVASCCLYGVRVNISNGNEGPLEGMLTIRSNCANVTPLTYCFKSIGTCYKVFEASTSPSFNTSTGCLHLQPYMYFDKCNEAAYWFVFAVNAACYSGQVLCADLFQRRGGISVASNNINAFTTFNETNLDATWKKYFVDLNSDNGSVTISSLSSCLLTTACMSTTSMKR